MIKLIAMVLACCATSEACASEVCWIERVTRDGDKVAVYFMSQGGPGQALVVPKDGAEGKVWRLQGGLVAPCPDPNARQCAFAQELSSDHLSLPAGAKIFMHNMPEDACTLTVVVDGQRTGLEARISQHLPGLPAADVRHFLPAQ